jgi:hypothetical protein
MDGLLIYYLINYTFDSTKLNLLHRDKPYIVNQDLAASLVGIKSNMRFFCNNYSKMTYCEASITCLTYGSSARLNILIRSALLLYLLNYPEAFSGVIVRVFSPLPYILIRLVYNPFITK